MQHIFNIECLGDPKNPKLFSMKIIVTKIAQLQKFPSDSKFY